MAPDQVEAWERQENSHHADEDRRARLKELGHEIYTHIVWMDVDGGKQYAACSCGWRDKRSSRIAGDGDEHLRNVEKELAAGQNIVRVHMARGVTDWEPRVVEYEPVDDSVRDEFQRLAAARGKR